MAGRGRLPTGSPLDQGNAVARVEIDAGVGFFGDDIEGLPERNLFEVEIDDRIRIAELVRSGFGCLTGEVGEGRRQGYMPLKRRQLRGGLFVIDRRRRIGDQGYDRDNGQAQR